MHSRMKMCLKELCHFPKKFLCMEMSNNTKAKGEVVDRAVFAAGKNKGAVIDCLSKSRLYLFHECIFAT